MMNRTSCFARLAFYFVKDLKVSSSFFYDEKYIKKRKPFFRHKQFPFRSKQTRKNKYFHFNFSFFYSSLTLVKLMIKFRENNF